METSPIIVQVRNKFLCLVHFSWCGLDDGRYECSQLLELIESDVRKTAAKERIKHTDCLIIDEISMISGRLFSMFEQICRGIRQTDVLKPLFANKKICC